MKDKQEIVVNAMIESASVRFDRDCFLSVWLSLNYGGTGQGFGGYILGATPECAAGKHDNQPNIAAEFIVSCMRAGGVEDFSKLVGKSIRVRKTDEWGDIIAIGHIIKDDLWFEPKARFQEMDAAFKGRLK